MTRIINEFSIPDRLWPWLITTAIDTVGQQGASRNCATVRARRKRGRERARSQREKWRGESLEANIGTLNVGSVTGKDRELANMRKRRANLLSTNNEWGSKLFYYGLDGRRNGVGIILREKLVKYVLEVKRVSDRI